MKKALGSILSTGLGILLLVYSATRSLDFIGKTLPPDRQILAWFGLAALDGGLVAWLVGFLHGSRGSLQRAVCFLMIIVDLLGAVAMFTLDTLYNTGQSGMTAAFTPEEMQTAVLALSIIIAVNIGAVVVHHLTDPDARKAMAEEEAQARIEDMTIEKVAAAAEQMAAEIAPQLAADWAEETRQRYTNLLTGRKATRRRLPASTVDVPPQPTSPTTIYQASASEEEPEPDPTHRQPRRRRA